MRKRLMNLAENSLRVMLAELRERLEAQKYIFLNICSLL